MPSSPLLSRLQQELAALTLQGFALVETLLVLSLLSGFSFGWGIFFSSSYDFSSLITASLSFICGLMSLVFLWGTINLLYEHARIARYFLIEFVVPDLAAREDNVLQDLEKPLLSAIGARDFATGLDLKVILVLERSCKLALTQGSQILRPHGPSTFFTPSERALLEDGLRASFEQHMGPRLMPFAIYLWPQRKITIEMKSPSRHQVISSLGKAQAARAEAST